MILYQDLGIANIDDLREAVESGRIAELKGFGARTESNIRRGLERFQQQTGRALVSVATDLAEDFIERISSSVDVERIDYAGSLRRMVETIGDVDLLVASDDPVPLVSPIASMSSPASTSSNAFSPRAKPSRAC